MKTEVDHKDIMTGFDSSIVQLVNGNNSAQTVDSTIIVQPVHDNSTDQPIPGNSTDQPVYGDITDQAVYGTKNCHLCTSMAHLNLTSEQLSSERCSKYGQSLSSDVAEQNHKSQIKLRKTTSIYLTDVLDAKHAFLPRLSGSQNRISENQDCKKTDIQRNQSMKLPEIRFVPNGLGKFAKTRSMIELLDPKMNMLKRSNTGQKENENLQQKLENYSEQKASLTAVNSSYSVASMQLKD